MDFLVSIKNKTVSYDTLYNEMWITFLSVRNFLMNNSENIFLKVVIRSATV